MVHRKEVCTLLFYERVVAVVSVLLLAHKVICLEIGHGNLNHLHFA